MGERLLQRIAASISVWALIQGPALLHPFKAVAQDIPDPAKINRTYEVDDSEGGNRWTIQRLSSYLDYSPACGEDLYKLRWRMKDLKKGIVYTLGFISNRKVQGEDGKTIEEREMEQITLGPFDKDLDGFGKEEYLSPGEKQIVFDPYNKLGKQGNVGEGSLSLICERPKEPEATLEEALIKLEDIAELKRSGYWNGAGEGVEDYYRSILEKHRELAS